MQTENEQSTVVIVLATSNRDKVREIRPLLEHLSQPVQVLTPGDIGVETEIEETETTLEGNARLKAETIFGLLSERYPWLIALADDTGLEVAALDGAPGVYSARYAPVGKDRTPTYDQNVSHLLATMQNEENRKASFRTVIAMKGRLPGRNGPVTFEKTVEGSVDGEITRQRAGDNGFGYDPVFWLNSAGTTFAQMSTERKNSLSHRSRAVRKAVEALGAVFEANR